MNSDQNQTTYPNYWDGKSVACPVYAGFDSDNPHCLKFIKALCSSISSPEKRKVIKNLAGFYNDPSMMFQVDRMTASGEERSKRKDGHYRRVRSDHIDVMVCVMAMYVAHLDFMTMRCGITAYNQDGAKDHYTKGQNKRGLKLLFAPSLEQLQIECGGIGYGAIQEARQHFERAVAFSITRDTRLKPDAVQNEFGKFPKGSVESFPSIVCISDHVLILLGLTRKELTKCRDRASARWKKLRDEFREKFQKRRHEVELAEQSARMKMMSKACQKIDEGLQNTLDRFAKRGPEPQT